MSSVGARTCRSKEPARSGRPPRDTTAPKRSGRFAAAMSAAPPPVLAPNRPIGRWFSSSSPCTQSAILTRRSASMRTLNRRCPVRRSTNSSSWVSRSMSSVASRSWSSAAATNWLRGLMRPLPLPCANTTIPVAPAGTPRSPISQSSPMLTRTSRVRAMVDVLPRCSMFVLPNVGSQPGWERLRHVAGLPARRALEWLQRARLVEMQHEIELFRQARAEIVAHALRAGTIDDADGPLEPRRRQRARHLQIVTKRKQETGTPGVVEQAFVTPRKRRPYGLALGWIAPVGCRRHRTRVRRLTDQHGAHPATLAHELSDVQLAALPHFRRARVTQMRVVCPHDDVRTGAALVEELHDLGKRVDHV